jgi:predicted DNA binding CopG/RHH family protein
VSASRCTPDLGTSSPLSSSGIRPLHHSRISQLPAFTPAILIPMESPTQRAESTSFAGLLSALASPAPRSSEWNVDALASDVATISYESALKARARFKPADEPTLPDHSPHADLRSSDESVPRRPPTSAAAHAEPKTASITIRMSQAECAQLKQRAAEAGITISAYLRSCTFEVESLRGQVKNTLAQLRSASSSQPIQPSPTPQQRRKFSWLSRVFSRKVLQLSQTN